MRTNTTHTDPDTDLQPASTDAADAAATAAAAEVVVDDPIATIDQAIDAANTGDDSPPAAAADPAKPDAAKPAADAAVDPNAAKDPAKVAADKKAEDDKKAAQQDVEALVAEAKAEGAAPKTQERIRTMANEIKALAPVREALTAAGITDLATLPRVLKDAHDGRDLVELVSSTGAQPEQFGMTLDYLAVATKANAGDMAAAKQAYELSMGEAKVWAELLGIDLPGVHDPLEAHPDLAELVAGGDMTKKIALETIALRNRDKVATASQQASQQQTQQQQVVALGVADLQKFDAAAAAQDPDYAAKRPALNKMVSFIRKTLPPSQWLAATQEAYSTIPAPAPAPEKLPRIGAPLRANGPRPALHAETDDPIALMDLAIGAAEAH